MKMFYKIMGYLSILTLGGITFDLIREHKVYSWGDFWFTLIYGGMCIALDHIEQDK